MASTSDKSRARCFIFGAGEKVPLRERPHTGDCVIAADGGMEYLSELGIVPNLVIGDFDSNTAPIPDGIETVRLPVEKDDTDMLYSVRKALDMGFSQIHICGGTGGRTDHTIANLQTLLYAAKRGCRAYLYSRDMIMTAVAGELKFSPRGTFSVFALGGNADGVSILGGKYEVGEATLTPDFPIGVSNSSVGKDVTVSVKSGCLLVMWNDCIGD